MRPAVMMVFTEKSLNLTMQFFFNAVRMRSMQTLAESTISLVIASSELLRCQPTSELMARTMQ